ncbi:hypothetical protein HYC85_020880 [Camellia sinensis]|uniref:Uncharacterized protein n=1 Tax=Camellia sinensis TaxID=4442 RepID=A0A7J7GV00_CAMSI|nr:hypothetical protein HYC85_020880 [Camellia sinensis]
MSESTISLASFQKQHSIYTKPEVRLCGRLVPCGIKLKGWWWRHVVALNLRCGFMNFVSVLQQSICEERGVKVILGCNLDGLNPSNLNPVRIFLGWARTQPK